MFKPTKSLKKDNKASIEMLGGIAIGILTLVIIFAIVGVVAPKIMEMQPDDLPATSVFNSTNAEYVDPGLLWTDNAPFIGLAVLIIILSVLMFYIYRMRSGGASGGV